MPVLARQWRREGVSLGEIAKRFRVHVNTVVQWRKSYPEFADALKYGIEEANSFVESALFQNAIAGNLGAQIFWLKNRMPDRWKDKPLEEQPGADDKINAIVSAITQVAKDTVDATQSEAGESNTGGDGAVEPVHRGDP